jgi:GH15 family glucan-1,4-alpha-glucosidase
MANATDYKPISDYAVIGNLRTVALIGRDGSIDWCCFPHLDRGSVFAAILDAKRGGRFKVSAPGIEMGEQQYVKDTNVLETRFVSGGGRLTVTDFMPLSGDIHVCGRSNAPHEIHRVLHAEGEDREVEIEWSPRFDYARAIPRIEKKGNGWIAAGPADTMTLCGVEDARISDEGFGPVLRSRFRIRSGDRRVIVTRWGSEDTDLPPEDSITMSRETAAIWEEWAHREGVVRAEEWAGEWLPMVVRSELLLKLLTHADTGAIAAAPTTSLPETIGGVRNWDYRYTWIRDASLTVQALVSMGHKSEAIELLYWMERVSAARCEEEWNLQIMYGLHGESDLDEKGLEHLEGYRGSRPVNIGNGAAKQFQLETYGELLNTGYELVRRGKKLEPKLSEFIGRVVEHLLGVWEKPDYGIWEMRAGARHFTYSKIMAWVALDRAILLAERHGFQGDAVQWRRERETVRGQILENGYNRDLGAFTLAYDSRDLDAANLRIPLLEFLPIDDPRVQGTIDRTIEQLTEKGLVYRYHTDDGLPGEEGAFGLCSFWLSDALALSKRLDEAWEFFTTMARHANHVGLFSEQIDPATGEFLGNFPQAFTHIGFINSLLYLAYGEGKKIPEHAPIGSSLHREMILNTLEPGKR